jgi:hypothetical protein
MVYTGSQLYNRWALSFFFKLKSICFSWLSSYKVFASCWLRIRFFPLWVEDKLSLRILWGKKRSAFHFSRLWRQLADVRRRDAASPCLQVAFEKGRRRHQRRQKSDSASSETRRRRCRPKRQFRVNASPFRRRSRRRNRGQVRQS